MRFNIQKSSKRKIWIGIVIGASVGLITLAALFAVLVLLFLYGGPSDVEENVEKYEEMLSKYSNAKTAYIVFPETIPASASDMDFYFSFQDTWNAPTQEVYLQCTYDETDYLAEIQRLEQTRKQYGSVTRVLLKDEEGRYPYPVYIAQDGYWDSYEYAMLTGENQITYVFTSMMRADKLKKVNKNLLPEDFDSRQEEYTGIEGYNIYLQDVRFYADGSVDSWSCDYTRDIMAAVTRNHWEEIGYNLFYVTTQLDETNKEVIRDCSYVYYESRHDSVYGLPEDIVYTELAGYPYVSMELSEDKSKAFVTYLDGEEEKVFEYTIPDVD